MGSKENLRRQTGYLKIESVDYPVYEGVNIIGRDVRASIRVNDAVFSKLHAIISVVDDTRHLLSDMNSANGTRIRKMKLEPFIFYNIHDKEPIVFGNRLGIYFKNSEVQNIIIRPEIESDSEKLPDTQLIDSELNLIEPLFDMPTQALVDENIHEAETQIIHLEAGDCHQNGNKIQVIVDENNSQKTDESDDATQVINFEELDIQAVNVVLSRSDDDIFADQTFRESLENSVSKYDAEVDETVIASQNKSKTNDIYDSDDDIILSTQDTENIDKQSREIAKKDEPNSVVNLDDSTTDIEDNFELKQTVNDCAPNAEIEDDIKNNKQMEDSDSDTDVELNLLETESESFKINSNVDFDLGLPPNESNDSKSNPDAKEDLKQPQTKRNLLKCDSESDENEDSSSTDSKITSSSQNSDQSKNEIFDEIDEDDFKFSVPSDFVVVTERIPVHLNTINERDELNEADAEAQLDEINEAETELVEPIEKSTTSNNTSDLSKETQLKPTTIEVVESIHDAETQLMDENNKTPNVPVKNSSNISINDDPFLASTQVLEPVLNKNIEKENDANIDDPFLAPTQVLEPVLNKNIEKENDANIDDPFLAPTQVLEPVLNKNIEKESDANIDDPFLAPTQVLEPVLNNNMEKESDANIDDPFLAPTQVLETVSRNGRENRNFDESKNDDIFLAPTQVLEPVLNIEKKVDDANIDDPFLAPTQVLETISENEKENISVDDVFLAPTQVLEPVLTEKTETKDDDDPFLAPTQILEPGSNKNDAAVQIKVVSSTENDSYNGDSFLEPTQILEPDLSKYETALRKDSVSSNENLNDDICLAPTQILEFDRDEIIENGNNSTTTKKSSKTVTKVDPFAKIPKIVLRKIDQLSLKSTTNVAESSEDSSLHLILSESDESFLRLSNQNEKIPINTEETETQLEVDFNCETQKLYTESSTKRPDNPLAVMFGEQNTEMSEEIEKIEKLKPIPTLVDLKNSKISLKDIQEASTSKIKRTYKKSTQRTRLEPTRKSRRNQGKKNNSDDDDSDDSETTDKIPLPTPSKRLKRNENTKPEKTVPVQEAADDDAFVKRKTRGMKMDYKSLFDYKSLYNLQIEQPVKTNRTSKAAQQNSESESSSISKSSTVTEESTTLTNNSSTTSATTRSTTTATTRSTTTATNRFTTTTATNRSTTTATNRYSTTTQDKSDSKASSSSKSTISPEGSTTSRSTRASVKRKTRASSNQKDKITIDSDESSSVETKRSRSTKSESNTFALDSSVLTTPTRKSSRNIKTDFESDDDSFIESSRSRYSKIRNQCETSKVLDVAARKETSVTPSRKTIRSVRSIVSTDVTNTSGTKKRNYQPLDVTVINSPSKGNQKYKVVFTMLHDPKLQETVEKLGGSVIDSAQECNVLVTNKITRSLKFLVAVALGKPIVNTKWIEDSAKNKSFLDPWDYILEDLESESKLKMSLRASLKRASERKLLSGEQIILAVNKNFDVLKELIETSGGKCISRVPAKNMPAVVVGYEEEKMKYSRYLKQKSLTIVSAEAIFTGVLQQKVNWRPFLLS